MDIKECTVSIIVAMINNGDIATPEQVSQAYKTIYATIANPIG